MMIYYINATKLFNYSKEDLTMKFMETGIPELFARTLLDQNLKFSANYTNKIVRVVVEGASACLGDLKSTEEPVALVFKSASDKFIAGAKVEYIPNPEEPTIVSSGSWSYVWTFDEEDIKDVKKVVYADDPQITMFFINKAGTLYGMSFKIIPAMFKMFNTVLELISNWLTDNAKADEPTEIVEDGVFRASAAVEGGEVVKDFVPEGDSKVLVKGDTMLQED